MASSPLDHAGRVARVTAAVQEREVGALLVTNATNVRYLTGFSGTNGQVLLGAAGAVFFTDPRYAARARDLVEGAEVVVYEDRLTDVLRERLAASGVTTLGIESTHITIAGSEELSKRLEGIELVPLKGVVEKARRVKEPAEIDLIAEAVRLGDETFAHMAGTVGPGIAERDVALDIEVALRRSGAEGVSFPPIVGSGPLSAHIHHTPGERVLENGDLLLLDFGCRLEGYCSDMTRTVVLGPATPQQQELYGVVLAAQAAGIEAVRAGASGSAVDKAARTVINDAGLGSVFGHGLGHGVGLDIHEAPRLHRNSDDVLEDGNVVTIEPGAYPPGGGIRIEDCVVVSVDGARVLGNTPKDRLLEL